MIASRNHPVSCGTPTSSFARQHAKRSLANRSFELQATEVRRATGSSSISTVTAAAKVLTRKTSASYVTDFNVSVNRRTDGYFQQVSVSSGNTAVLSELSSGAIATYQSTGECVFRGESQDGEVALARVVSGAGAGVSVDTFQSWVAGSLASHCTSQIASLTATKTGLNVFNSGTFVRNAGCWANGVDLSCASPWNSTGGPQRAGTLVSRRHVLFCKHASFYPTTGASMLFVSPDSTPVYRTLSAILPVPNVDIVVGLLDSEVPESISFARVMPSNYTAYLPGIDGVSSIPVMTLNQSDRASVAALRHLSASFENTYPDSYPSYSGTIVSGDSGNPVFWVVNGSPVLLGVLTIGGYGGGSIVSAYASVVNAAMTTLGGGYTLTSVNLTGFPTY